MKRILGTVAAAALLVAGAAQAKDKKIVFGMSQIGAESEWRTANTQSIKEAAKTAGINLKFSDAQQKQENQIKAIRAFIAQKVDVIGFAPVVATGWDTVLREAKAAKIPVILTDRSVDSDPSLYEVQMGSDFRDEGERAGRWLVKEMKKRPGTEQIDVVELQGTTGANVTNERKAGFEAEIKADPRLKIVRSQTGDFTRAKGKEVMEAFIKAEKKIDVLYAHNDDMAIGAIQAIEEAGLKPGKDIVIIGVDGVKGAFEAMMAGKMNVSIECSPLLGPQLMEVVKKLASGEKVPRRIVTIEKDYPAEIAAREFPNRKY